MQEDESVLKRRKEDEQDRPVDILSVPRHQSPLASLLPDSYDAFVALNNNDDADESFYPPPEIEEYYEPGLPGEVNGLPAAGVSVQPVSLLDDPNAYEDTGRRKRRGR